MSGSGRVVALVPLRSPGAGKTRLAAGLSREERAALAGAMLADVAGALRASPVDAVVVAASGAEAAAAAAALGLDVVDDPPGSRGLDAAVAAASARLSAGTLLVVTADLPRVSPDDIDAVLEPDAAVTIAPASDGGTAVLVRRPKDVIGTAYGPSSAARHRDLARAAGVAVATVDRPALRHDVDVWDDLRALRQVAVGAATAAFLERLGSRLEETA